MGELKVWLIADDNGIIYDLTIGDESKRQIIEKTKEFFEDKYEKNWIKPKLFVLPIEGKIHKGHTNIITTIKLNNIPFRAIANSFHSLVEIVENYMDLESDFRKYDFNCQFVKIN